MIGNTVVSDIFSQMNDISVICCCRKITRHRSFLFAVKRIKDMFRSIIAVIRMKPLLHAGILMLYRLCSDSEVKKCRPAHPYQHPFSKNFIAGIAGGDTTLYVPSPRRVGHAPKKGGREINAHVAPIWMTMYRTHFSICIIVCVRTKRFCSMIQSHNLKI